MTGGRGGIAGSAVAPSAFLSSWFFTFCDSTMERNSALTCSRYSTSHAFVASGSCDGSSSLVGTASGDGIGIVRQYPQPEHSACSHDATGPAS